MKLERHTVWVALALFLSTAALFIHGSAPGANAAPVDVPVH